jgi:hypothetical protein
MDKITAKMFVAGMVGCPPDSPLFMKTADGVQRVRVIRHGYLHTRPDGTEFVHPADYPPGRPWVTVFCADED